jgi:hypothetical protein
MKIAGRIIEKMTKYIQCQNTLSVLGYGLDVHVYYLIPQQPTWVSQN